MNELKKTQVNQLTVETTMPIFWADLSHIPDQLLSARQAIDELRAANPETVQSNVKSAYMSSWKSHQLNNKLLPICQTVTEFAHQAALEHMNTDFSRLNWRLQVTDCWGAIYEESDYTIPHTHFPSDFSAVVYLEAEENCAPIVFANKLVVQPKPRMLVMFPGMLLHSVPKTDGRRVVLVMNMQKFPSFPSNGPAPQADPMQAEVNSAPVPEVS
jgi:hypothetical protein